ncbi:MAG: DUF5668 domain-containing protein [Bacteroidota bacterium]
MKYKNILWGVILIGIGILFILRNLGMIHFEWRIIFQLWPLIFILWGISILPVKDYIKLILSGVSIIAAMLIISHNQTNIYSGWGCHYSNNKWEQQSLNESYDTTITKATLQFDAAAGNFNIAGITTKLIDFDNKGNLGNYKIFSSMVDSAKVIKIEPEKNIININGNSIDNNTFVKLNANPLWNINVEAGMANLNLDLSMFKIDKVKIEGGMSKITIKFGALTHNIKLDIEAGASSINILVPQESGCEVKTDNVLSNKVMPGFKEVDDDTYQSESFITKPNKVFISIEAAVSKLNIQRY